MRSAECQLFWGHPVPNSMAGRLKTKLLAVYFRSIRGLETYKSLMRCNMSLKLSALYQNLVYFVLTVVFKFLTESILFSGMCCHCLAGAD